jgi:hypothetical protein
MLLLRRVMRKDLLDSFRVRYESVNYFPCHWSNDGMLGQNEGSEKEETRGKVCRRGSK